MGVCRPGRVHGARLSWMHYERYFLERRLANVQSLLEQVHSEDLRQALEEVVVELEQKLDASRGESPPSGSTLSP